MTDRSTTSELAMPASFEAYPAPDATEPVATSPIAAILGLLRGRYKWAIGIGSVLAAIGFVVGVKATKPTFKSMGVIDVAPKVPKVLYESDEKAMLPLFDAFATSQASLCTSRRVVDLAMDSEGWKQLGRGRSDEDISQFRVNLNASHPKSTQHFEVTFTDNDPDAAMVGVNEVIRAYMKLVVERENASGQITINALEDTKKSINARLNDIRTDVLAVTGDLGEPALKGRYGAAMDELGRHESVLHQLNLEIARAKAVAGPDGHALTDEEIGLKDMDMQRLLMQKSDAEEKVTYLVDVSKLGPNNPELVTAKRELAAIERRVEQRAATYRATVANLSGGSGPDSRIEEVARVTKLRDEKLDEIRRLARKLNDLQKLEAERTSLGERMAEVKRRLEQISVESEVRGRISVSAYGDRPPGPDTDRRLSLAMLGASGGMGLGFGIVLLWGLREGRMRYMADVSGGPTRARFLGVLPEVASSGNPAEASLSSDMADYCVHHIRTMLQLRAPNHESVVALTSPSPGAGKTTLSIALGMSFAAAGSRTLLIDCDLVGHGLTSAVRSLVCDRTAEALTAPDPSADAGKNGRRRIMSALLAARRLSFDDGQVAELLAATRERAAAGDAPSARTALALEALARPREGGSTELRRGIVGVLDGRPLEQCVMETDLPNLSLLPIGDGTEDDAKGLSREGLERLVAACRERYDTVLIDTGPVLGSIEAAFAAAVADDVLVVVARGERRPAVDDALERIANIGAEVAGVVFNRATSADVAMSSYGSRSQSKAAQVA